MDHNHGPEYFLLFNHENFARMITNDRHVLGERHGEELKMFGWWKTTCCFLRHDIKCDLHSLTEQNFPPIWI